MKINEIIQEAPIGGFKQLATDYKVHQMGNKAVKLWKKYLNTLEAKNNYEPLTPAQLEQNFLAWVDSTLLGKYSISNVSNDFKQTIDAYKTKVGQKPRDNILLKQALSTIIDGSRKLGLASADATAGSVPTAKDCTVTTANNKLTVCGTEINPVTDKETFDKLNKLLTQQGKA